MSGTDTASADPEVSSLVFSSFSTDGLPIGDAAAIWCESISPMFASRPVVPERFHGSIEACLLDRLVLARGHASAQEFRRDRRMQRRDGIDHVLVQFYRAGGYRGEHAGKAIDVRPGDIGILDLAAETHTLDSDFRSLTLVIPRDELRPLLGQVDCGGITIPGRSPLGRILTSLLAATWHNLPALGARDAPHAAQTVLAALASCIQAHRDDATGAPPELPATAAAVRDYIEQTLAHPGLDPNHLCGVFRCSRSYLYRLFAPEGGVVRYIQARRVARCYAELTQAAGRGTRVTDIAARWGFVNPSHFSRVFRETYGIAPREARRSSSAGSAPAWSAAPERASLPAYYDWLLTLARERPCGIGTTPSGSA
jgi:AraC-like DNA-binding protein